MPTVNQRLARAQAADPGVFLPKLARQLDILARDVSLLCSSYDTDSITYVRDLLSVLAPIVRGDVKLGPDAVEAIDGLVGMLTPEEEL